MADLLDETFEGDYDGYDNDGWAESVSGGCTVNQDSSMPSGSIPNLGTECLFVEADSVNDSANTKYTIDSTTDISYIRIYFNINSLTVTGNEVCRLMEVWNSDLDIPVYCDLKEGPVLYVYFWSDGAYVSHNTNISNETWYCLELKYDATGSAYEWKLDGVSKNADSLVDPQGGHEVLLCGIIQYGGDTASSYYIDAVKWSDSEYAGTLEDRQKNYYPLLYLLMLDEIRGWPGSMGGMKWT